MENEIQKLLTNEEFMSKVAKSKTEDEVKDLFASEGVELNESQIKELKNLFEEATKELNELDSEELDKVAGGLRKEYKLGIIGASLGVLIGAFAGYKAIKTDDKMSKKVLKVLGSAVVGSIAGMVGGELACYWWFKIRTKITLEQSEMIFRNNVYKMR
ncbi:MAG: hypothetical protein LBK29_01675 [Oscillospiraceae bacterium]|jgi:hypothetical protein|nr:hypothetical protein [Oscillospiraceae bacterium]